MEASKSAGFGVRAAHYGTLLAEGVPKSAGWAEIISENFVGRGGRPQAVLERVRADVPVVMHGVSLSLGGVDPIPRAELAGLRELARRYDVAWLSDHLSFGTHGGHHAHDLWPLPFTSECVRHVARRIREVQDFFGARIAVENVSSYVTYAVSELSEAEFVAAVVEEADCDLLLDVNNVFVNAHNHGFDARTYLAEMPAARVRQMHVAGHLDLGHTLLDDHGRAVCDAVWALLREASARFPAAPVIVEWDGAVPPLARLADEVERCARERALGVAQARSAA